MRKKIKVVPKILMISISITARGRKVVTKLVVTIIASMHGPLKQCKYMHMIGDD
jgi:hypothetical protein